MLKRLFLLFLVVAFAFPFTASAENNYPEIITDASLTAMVKKVYSHKRIVWLDKGKEAGFIMGAKVCFFSSSDELIICGNVVQTKPSNSWVRVKTSIRKIKKGMKAALIE